MKSCHYNEFFLPVHTPLMYFHLDTRIVNSIRIILQHFGIEKLF